MDLGGGQRAVYPRAVTTIIPRMVQNKKPKGCGRPLGKLRINHPANTTFMKDHLCLIFSVRRFFYYREISKSICHLCRLGRTLFLSSLRRRDDINNRRHILPIDCYLTVTHTGAECCQLPP